jgi:hypothetical protein
MKKIKTFRNQQDERFFYNKDIQATANSARVLLGEEWFTFPVYKFHGSDVIVIGMDVFMI